MQLGECMKLHWVVLCKGLNFMTCELCTNIKHCSTQNYENWQNVSQNYVKEITMKTKTMFYMKSQNEVLFLPQFKTYETSVRKIIIFEKLWNRSTIPKRAKNKEVQLSSLFAWKKQRKKEMKKMDLLKEMNWGESLTEWEKYTIRFIIHMQIKFLIIYISNAKNKY